MVFVTAEINFASSICFEKSLETEISVELHGSKRTLYSTPSAQASFSTISKDGLRLPASICVIYGAETPVFSANNS